MEKKPKQRGDRRDGYLVRDGDPMHIIMPFILGERADNEAVVDEVFDLSAIDRYLAEKNSQSPKYKYTYFHVILAALAKTIYLRPKMNRFIIGHRYYDRNNISFSFVAKNQMSDNGSESLLIIEAEDDQQPIIEQLHNKICEEVYKVKSEEAVDGTTENMQWLVRIPRPILKLVVRFLFWLNAHDRLPKFLAPFDPYRTTVFVSNLGSIKMSAGYHHLVNWSTNSLFVVLNQAKMRPFFENDGSYEMRNSMSMGFTIDERIADGFYFAKSIMLFKDLLMHPELLDQPISTPHQPE